MITEPAILAIQVLKAARKAVFHPSSRSKQQIIHAAALHLPGWSIVHVLPPTKRRSATRDKQEAGPIPFVVREGLTAPELWEVTTPDGAVLADANAYGLTMQMLDHGIEQAICDALDMKPWDPRIDDRGNERTASQGMGTCGICGGAYKLVGKRGVIALHGYRRPGDGYIRGDCHGHYCLPWEVSAEACVRYLKTLEQALDSNRRHQLDVEADRHNSYSYSPPEPPWEIVAVSRGEPLFEAARRQRLGELRGTAEDIRESMDWAQKRIASWVAQDLPE